MNIKICKIFLETILINGKFTKLNIHPGSDGSMSASGSAGPGFDSQRGSKFSFENF